VAGPQEDCQDEVLNGKNCRRQNKTKLLMSENGDSRQMKIGMIISQTDPETVWNALRFSNTAILEGHEIKIFLLGAGVEIEKIERKVQRA
jgi:hypothetical protein